MKNSSLYTNVRTNQIKIAIFMVGFFLLAMPGKTDAKLISVGTSADTVSFGNNVGIGTTIPGTPLEISSSSDAILRLRQAGGGWNYIEFYNDTTRQGYFGIASNGNDFQFSPVGNTYIPSGNVGIGLTNPGTKLDVTGTFRNSLATTHTLLGGAGNAVVMTDNSGGLFSMSTATFTASAASVSTLYHIKPWFIPAAGQTISSSGATVTMLNPVANFQFSSSMIGSKLTINGESRIITAYTSTSVVTVDSTYSTNYSGISNTLWGVYSRAVNIAADGSISTYSEVGQVAIQKRSGDTNTYIPALLDSNNKYYWPSTVLYLNKDFPIKWSNATTYSSGTNDVGLRRTASGTLEIYDGTAATPGTASAYRDLNIRSLNPNGDNIGIGTTTPSNNKLTVVSDQGGGGVIKVQNTNIASWSSYEMFDYAGVHKASFGYANPNAPTVAGLAHFSTSDDTPFIIAIHDLEKMRVTTNGRIGIGETNPQQKFTISGTSTASTIQTNISAYADGGIRINGIGAYSQDAITYQASDGGGAAIAFRRGGGYDTNIDFYTTDGSSSAGAITQAMTINYDRNVGIGITNPNSVLHVFTTNSLYAKLDTNNLHSWLNFARNNVSYANIGIGDSGYYGMPYTNALSFRSNAGYAFGNDGGTSWWMNINSSGNVGIGTTTPAQKLDVVGSIALPATTSATAGVIYKGTNRFIHDFALPGTSGVNTFVGVSAGNFTMTGSTGLQGSFNTAIGGSALAANTTGMGNTASGIFALSANTTGGANTASGLFSLSGTNIGGANTASGAFSLTANTTGDGNTASGYYAAAGNTTAESNVAIGFEALKINTTGSRNVAIGRGALIDLNITTNDLTGYNTVIGAYTGGGIVTGVNNTIIGANVTGLAAALSNNIIIADGAGNQRINVDSSGDVGIGTTAPANKLTVAGGGITVSGAYVAQTGANVSLSQEASYGQLQSWNSLPLYINPLGNSIIMNRDGGNVAIGTTTATAKLTVAGTTKLGTAGTAFTAMGTCTIASTAITSTKANYTCTGVPASTSVAVNCSGAAAQSGVGTLYCRATGTANQVACNTSAANTTAMTWACMWIQP
jgi:hypothetical protein